MQYFGTERNSTFFSSLFPLALTMTPPKINTTDCASFEVRTDSDDAVVLFC